MPLDVLLRPRSVAVIGASRKRGSIGAELFHNLLAAAGFTGAVYPVNPRVALPSQRCTPIRSVARPAGRQSISR